MKVKELMTRDVLSVRLETSLKEVAELLVGMRISGVPVCDEQRHVLGVVSEADIMVKEEGFLPERGGLLGWLFAPPVELVEKIAARTAGETMTSPPLTIEPDCKISEAARLMAGRAVNRLPVVADGVLVGILTRADLVRAFLRSDEEIRREIVEEVLLRTLWIEPERVELTVERGHVSLAGQLGSRSEAELVEAYVRLVPGIVDVDSRLTWSVDDLSRRKRLTRVPAR